ncbi:hypothetical protein B0H14DRAFT_2564762 [Mycena olivaceomarginata]|nr:hypothetical protein B0H14DRAFT_2564762 [Mycena olivaceomarginata]
MSRRAGSVQVSISIHSQLFVDKHGIAMVYASRLAFVSHENEIHKDCTIPGCWRLDQPTSISTYHRLNFGNGPETTLVTAKHSLPTSSSRPARPYARTVAQCTGPTWVGKADRQHPFCITPLPGVNAEAAQAPQVVIRLPHQVLKSTYLPSNCLSSSLQVASGIGSSPVFKPVLFKSRHSCTLQSFLKSQDILSSNGHLKLLHGLKTPITATSPAVRKTLDVCGPQQVKGNVAATPARPPCPPASCCPVPASGALAFKRSTVNRAPNLMQSWIGQTSRAMVSNLRLLKINLECAVVQLNPG